MPYCKKIVILSSIEGDLTQKGVLGLEQNGVKLKCVLKTFGKGFSDDLVLGLKIGDNLLSPINVLCDKGKNFEFELNNSLNLSDQVSVLLCEKFGINFRALLYGGNDNEESVVREFVSEVANFGQVGVVPKEIKKIKPEIEMPYAEVAQTSLFDENEDEVENLIDGEMQKLFNEKEEEKEPIFFDLVEEQVEQMFKTYPADETLQKLVISSRWAKVDYDGEGLYYSLGLIYSDAGDITKICYAVPAKFGQTPPDDIAEYCKWLPIDKTQYNSDGFFVMLQNAKTGENEKMQA